FRARWVYAGITGESRGSQPWPCGDWMCAGCGRCSGPQTLGTGASVGAPLGSTKMLQLGGDWVEIARLLPQNRVQTMSAAAVFGREEELGSIEAFLDELRPRALLIAGEPGIGKTILWEAGVEAARGRSRRVLVHRAVEPEAKLAFIALSDLIGGTFGESLASLSPPRRRALEVALLLAEPGTEAPDPRGIALALLDV